MSQLLPQAADEDQDEFQSRRAQRLDADPAAGDSLPIGDSLPAGSSSPAGGSPCNTLMQSRFNRSCEIASRLPVPSAAAVQRFKALFRERFGEELDDEQARDLATRFMHLFTLIAIASHHSSD